MHRRAPWSHALAALALTAVPLRQGWSEEGGTSAVQAATSRAIAALDEERVMVTPKGTLVIEPSLQFIHSSSTEVAIEGFTVIPSLAIGLFNINETQRDTLQGALSLRYGVARRFEMEMKVPYVYRQEAVKEREILSGSSVDVLHESDGQGLGDVELSARYQLNGGGDGGTVFIGGLRAKSRTGTGPFEVERRVLRDDQGERIGEIFAEQPTGSGFWSIQPNLSVLLPTAPAVLYGSLNYLWSLERDVGAPYGTVNPGDSWGFGFGVGLAANNRTSFSLGYDHSIVGNSRIENDNGAEPHFRRLQIGTLQFGIAQTLSKRTSLSLSVGVGVTPQAPNVQVTGRVPIRR